jgi:hypothetical protein
MTERMSSWDPEILEARGVPSKNLINLYRRWGEGGIGLIISGNILIEYDHLEAAGNAIVPRKSELSGERFEAFKEMASVAKKNGFLFVGQLNHPGRQVESRLQKKIFPKLLRALPLQRNTLTRPDTMALSLMELTDTSSLNFSLPLLIAALTSTAARLRIAPVLLLRLPNPSVSACRPTSLSASSLTQLSSRTRA